METGVHPEHPRATASRRGAAMSMDGEGRIGRGFRLLRQAWNLLAERPRLFFLPALSALLLTIATLAIFVPTLVLTEGVGSYKVSFFLATAATAVPFIFVSTFLNVAFLGMAQDHIEGREPSVRRGLALARSRLRPIVAWTLIAAFVGGILGALRALPFDSSELFARVAGLAGDIAWGLATYFVVPVLALHGDGAMDSVRRSARTLRDRWGETISGAVGIGVIFGIVIVPACLLGVGGATALDEGNVTLGVVLIALAVAISVPVLAVETALAELFSLVVYREATDGLIIAPFHEGDIRRAFELRKPPLRQRIRDWFRG